MSDIINAPWTDDQVATLNTYQQCGHFHPYTCGICRADLVATNDGWRCPADGCNYVQHWAGTELFSVVQQYCRLKQLKEKQ